MSKIYKVFEDYINSPTNRIHTLMKNIIKMFKEVFDGESDTLSEDELNTIFLVEIESSLESDPFEKNLIMNFSDNVYYYQIIFIIKVEDVKNEDPIEDAYMKIKIYDTEGGNMLREWQSNLKIQECTSEEQNEEGRFFVKVKEVENSDDDGGELDYIENFIISKVAELKEPLDKKYVEGEE